MRNVELERRLDAPRSSVWAVLADFPNIADWNDGIKKSYATSEALEGVGAKRHCDLAPLGELEETIVEWSPDDKMVISVDKAAKIPIKSGLVSFTLAESDGATEVTLSYDYEPKGGPLAAFVGPFLDKQLTKGFTGFLSQLEPAAQSRATA